MPDSSPFSGLQQLLALHNNPGAIKLREQDLVFEVPPVGFFKIAEAKGENERVQVLYYARHPEDFDPSIPIKDNNRIIPIDIEEIPNREDIRWDPTNPNRQHNVSWVYPVLTTLVNQLPPALMEEANLHRLDDDNFVSGYISYRTIKDKAVPDGRRVLVSTNSSKQFRPIADKHHPKERTGSHKTIQTFRECGRHLLGCALPLIPSLLEVVDAEDTSAGAKDSRRSLLEKHEIFSVIRGDYVCRESDVMDGDGPQRSSENRLVPIKHWSEKQQVRVDTMIKEYANNKRSLLVDIGSLAFHFIADGPVQTAIGLATDTAFDGVSKAITPQRYSAFVPKKWHGLLRKDRIDTMTNDLLLRIKEDKFFKTEPFDKLEWISAEGNTFNIPTQPAAINQASADGFQTWLVSQFFAPYEALFEYIGEGGVLVGPKDVGKIKAIRCNAPNGLQMYYVPETQNLFAYYHRPKVEVRAADEDRADLYRMPSGSELMFRHNKVLKLNLAKGFDAPIDTVMFHQFAQQMHITLGSATLGKGNEYGDKERLINFLGAHQYSPDVPYCSDATYRLYHGKYKGAESETNEDKGPLPADLGSCAGTGGNSMNPRGCNFAHHCAP